MEKWEQIVLELEREAKTYRALSDDLGQQITDLVDQRDKASKRAQEAHDLARDMRLYFNNEPQPEVPL